MKKICVCGSHGRQHNGHKHQKCTTNPLQTPLHNSPRLERSEDGTNTEGRRPGGSPLRCPPLGPFSLITSYNMNGITYDGRIIPLSLPLINTQSPICRYILISIYDIKRQRKQCPVFVLLSCVRIGHKVPPNGSNTITISTAAISSKSIPITIRLEVVTVGAIGNNNRNRSHFTVDVLNGCYIGDISDGWHE